MNTKKIGLSLIALNLLLLNSSITTGEKRGTVKVYTTDGSSIPGKLLERVLVKPDKGNQIWIEVRTGSKMEDLMAETQPKIQYMGTRVEYEEYKRPKKIGSILIHGKIIKIIYKEGKIGIVNSYSMDSRSIPGKILELVSIKTDEGKEINLLVKVATKMENLMSETQPEIEHMGTRVEYLEYEQPKKIGSTLVYGKTIKIGAINTDQPAFTVPNVQPKPVVVKPAKPVVKPVMDKATVQSRVYTNKNQIPNIDGIYKVRAGRKIQTWQVKNGQKYFIK